jgi:hypothetical protein
MEYLVHDKWLSVKKERHVQLIELEKNDLMGKETEIVP